MPPPPAQHASLYAISTWRGGLSLAQPSGKSIMNNDSLHNFLPRSCPLMPRCLYPAMQPVDNKPGSVESYDRQIGLLPRWMPARHQPPTRISRCLPSRARSSTSQICDTHTATATPPSPPATRVCSHLSLRGEKPPTTHHANDVGSRAFRTASVGISSVAHAATVIIVAACVLVDGIVQTSVFHDGDDLARAHGRAGGVPSRSQDDPTTRSRERHRSFLFVVKTIPCRLTTGKATLGIDLRRDQGDMSTRGTGIETPAAWTRTRHSKLVVTR